MKRRFDGKKTLTIIFLLTLLFIWGQSALPRSVSSVESGFLTFFLFGDGSSEGLVRKYAHFTEYSILGAELSAIVSLFIRKYPGKEGAGWRHVFPASLNLGLIIAFFDETIQYFSKREPEVRDIWIDLLGICAGSLIYCIFTSVKGRKG